MVPLTAKRGAAAKRTTIIVASVFPLVAFVVPLGSAQAARINTEASSPQRTSPSMVRPPIPRVSKPSSVPQRTPTPTTNRDNDGVPDRSWGGALVPAPAMTVPRATIRRETIPVLGRETNAPAPKVAPVQTPIANTPPATTHQISITASEPTLTSTVRPQDVATFQKIGAPYQVAGTWYVPAHEPDYDETGIASWYGADFHGRSTANGEIFDMNVVTAAHPTLPIPSLVEVTNLTNGRSMVVRINDRGPFIGNRLIDLSARGAQLLGFQQQGHTNVRVRYVGPANSEPLVTAQNISTGRSLVAASTPVKAGPAFVQVGAFSLRENAEQVARQARAIGKMQVVEAMQTNGNPLYRVVLGPVSNRGEADEKAQELSSNGFTGAQVMASLN